MEKKKNLGPLLRERTLHWGDELKKLGLLIVSTSRRTASWTSRQGHGWSFFKMAWRAMLVVLFIWNSIIHAEGQIAREAVKYPVAETPRMSWGGPVNEKALEPCDEDCLCDAPRKPSPPYVVEVAFHEVKLSWNTTTAIDNVCDVAAQLQMQMEGDHRDGDDSGIGWTTMYNGPAKQAVVDKLPLDQRFWFRVRERNCQGVGEWSEPTMANTPSDATRPSAPTAESVNVSTICTRWQNFGQDRVILSYREALNSSSGVPGTWQTGFDGQGTVVCIDGLSSSTYYQLRYQVQDPVLENSYSDLATVKTHALPPLTPNAPVVNFASQRSLAIKWDTRFDQINRSPATMYVVEAALAGDPENADIGAYKTLDFYRVAQVEEATTLVDELRPGTPYAFRVRAINSAGESDASEPLMSATFAAAPEPVDEIRFTQGTQDSIRIDWEPPSCNGAPILGYDVRLSKGGSASQFQRVPESYSKNYAHIEGLEAGTTYGFSVRAKNSVDNGVWGKQFNIKTALPGGHLNESVLVAASRPLYGAAAAASSAANLLQQHRSGGTQHSALSPNIAEEAAGSQIHLQLSSSLHPAVKDGAPRHGHHVDPDPLSDDLSTDADVMSIRGALPTRRQDLLHVNMQIEQPGSMGGGPASEGEGSLGGQILSGSPSGGAGMASEGAIDSGARSDAQISNSPAGSSDGQTGEPASINDSTETSPLSTPSKADGVRDASNNGAHGDFASSPAINEGNAGDIQESSGGGMPGSSRDTVDNDDAAFSLGGAASPSDTSALATEQQAEAQGGTLSGRATVVEQTGNGFDSPTEGSLSNSKGTNADGTTLRNPDKESDKTGNMADVRRTSPDQEVGANPPDVVSGKCDLREGCMQKDATTKVVPKCPNDCYAEAGQGYCMPNERCQCAKGWSGDNCNEADCRSMGDCSGHGKCVKPDKCACDVGYNGKKCNQFFTATFQAMTEMSEEEIKSMVGQIKGPSKQLPAHDKEAQALIRTIEEWPEEKEQLPVIVDPLKPHLRHAKPVGENKQKRKGTYFTLPSLPQFEIVKEDDHTFMLWFRAAKESAGKRRAFLAKGNHFHASGFGMGIVEGGNLYCGIGTDILPFRASNLPIAITEESYADGIFHHFACRISRTKSSRYPAKINILVDGNEVPLRSTFPFTGGKITYYGELLFSDEVQYEMSEMANPNAYDYPLVVGAGYDMKGEQFSGQITDIRVYRIALTYDTIREQMWSPTQVSVAANIQSLVLYLPLSDCNDKKLKAVTYNMVERRGEIFKIQNTITNCQLTYHPLVSTNT